MLESAVGKITGKHRASDVLTVQRIVNCRDDLRKPLPKLTEDGVYGTNTQAAIDHIQKQILTNPDGRIDPFGVSIKRMWPLAYANPTGKAIRKSDHYGEGHFGASRGRRTHDGTDYVAIAGQHVKAPISGKVVKISRPYASGVDAHILSGVHIVASDGTQCWVWYMQPAANIVGKVVKAGDNIGIAKTLKNRYKKGITDHVHVRIHGRFGKKINPSTVIK